MTLGSVVALLGLTALGASYVPARRATQVDPVDWLSPDRAGAGLAPRETKKTESMRSGYRGLRVVADRSRPTTNVRSATQPMHVAFEALRALSVALFLYYGLSVVFSQAMVAEFERFGLTRFRKMTGALEVLGALGLIAGYRFPTLTVVAAGGLTLLMLLGVATRIRVRDSVMDTLPATVLAASNLYVATYAIALMTPA